MDQNVVNKFEKIIQNNILSFLKNQIDLLVILLQILTVKMIDAYIFFLNQ